MPSETSECQILGDAWTLSDQVEELRGKFHLKRKDLDAYRESSRAEIKKNEKVIRHLRQENRLKHVLVAEHEIGDERVIKTVFSDDRKELLALQRFTAAGAIEEMDQTVCQAAQFLNALRHEREKREAKLVEAEVELERMKQQAQVLPEQVKRDKNITRLENSLDKAQVKYETASSISSCYENILDKLREESLTLPAKLDAMEAALLQQQKELKELKMMANDAHASRDEAKQQLALVESEAYESKRQRDSELTATRKEVESRNAESDKTEKRAARAALLIDTSDQKAQELPREQEKKKNILLNEEIFRRIKESANVTSIPESLERVASNRQIYDHLKAQISNLEATRNRLHGELALLTQQNHEMKYTGDQKISRGQKCLAELHYQQYDEQQKQECYARELEIKGNALIKIKGGVATILEKLSPVKLKPPQHSFTHGDVFEQLELCQKKMDQLLLDMASNDADRQKEMETLNSEEFLEFLETRIPSDNVRIRFESSDAILAFDHIRSEETQEILTRKDVKQIGQKLIDARERPKKRKAKKAK